MALDFIPVGDLHIGKFNTLFAPEKAREMHLSNLDQAIRIARKIYCPNLALMGDVFDNPFPSQDEIGGLLRRLHSNKDIHFLVYPGNHDRDDADEFSMKVIKIFGEISALPNVTFVFEPQLIRWAGGRVFVMPWGYKEKAPAKADVILFHHDLVGAETDTGSIIEANGKALKRSFFQGMPAISGHLHTPQTLGDNVLYCGTSAPLSFGEKNNKKLWRVSNKSGSLRWKQIPHEPNWFFKTVQWDAKNPPDCDEPNTFYRLQLKPGDQIPARWTADHPQVLRTEAKKKKSSNEPAAEGDGSKAESTTTEDQTELLKEWLSKRSSLNPKQIRTALRLDREMGETV